MWVSMEFRLKTFNNYKGVLCELLYCKKRRYIVGYLEKI